MLNALTYPERPANQPTEKNKNNLQKQDTNITDSKDAYPTQSEIDDENQDSQYPTQKTATKPNQQQTRNQRSIMDIQRTNITTRKTRTNVTESDYKITTSHNCQNKHKKKTTNNNRKPQTKKNQMTPETTVIPETRPEEMPDIITIPETDLEAMSQTQTTEILSPSVVTNNRVQIPQKTLDTTPETIDSSTPNINDLATNNDLIPRPITT